MSRPDEHPAAIVHRQVIEQVDRYMQNATNEERADFWVVFAARTMGMLAAQIGKENFDAFLAGTTSQADELFQAGTQAH